MTEAPELPADPADVAAAARALAARFPIGMPWRPRVPVDTLLIIGGSQHGKSVIHDSAHAGPEIVVPILTGRDEEAGTVEYRWERYTRRLVRIEDRVFTFWALHDAEPEATARLFFETWRP